MIKLFQDDYKAVGIMCLVTFILWVIIIIYHVYVFVIARLEFKKLGGLRAAQKEAAKEGVRRTFFKPKFKIHLFFRSSTKSRLGKSSSTSFCIEKKNHVLFVYTFFIQKQVSF